MDIQDALSVESCDVGLDLGGLRWGSKLQEGSDSTLQAWSLSRVRVPRDKVRVALSIPPHLRCGVLDGGKGLWLEAGPSPGLCSICIYILHALQMDFSVI